MPTALFLCEETYQIKLKYRIILHKGILINISMAFGIAFSQSVWVAETDILLFSRIKGFLGNASYSRLT